MNATWRNDTTMPNMSRLSWLWDAGSEQFQAHQAAGSPWLSPVPHTGKPGKPLYRTFAVVIVHASLFDSSPRSNDKFQPSWDSDGPFKSPRFEISLRQQPEPVESSPKCVPQLRPVKPAKAAVVPRTETEFQIPIILTTWSKRCFSMLSTFTEDMAWLWLCFKSKQSLRSLPSPWNLHQHCLQDLVGQQAEQSEFPHSSEPWTNWMAWMLELHVIDQPWKWHCTCTNWPILLSFSRAKPYSLEHPASFVQNDSFLLEHVTCSSKYEDPPTHYVPVLEAYFKLDLFLRTVSAWKSQTALDPLGQQVWIRALSCMTLWNCLVSLCRFVRQKPPAKNKCHKRHKRRNIVLRPAVHVVCCTHDQWRFIRPSS